MSSNGRSCDASISITTCPNDPCELLLPASFWPSSYCSLLVYYIMENDYRYLFKVGFLDDEDEELNIDFDAAIEEVTSTGSLNCEICQKNIKQ